jgi:hypothetical protein
MVREAFCPTSSTTDLLPELAADLTDGAGRGHYMNVGDQRLSGPRDGLSFTRARISCARRRGRLAYPCAKDELHGHIHGQRVEPIV